MQSSGIIITTTNSEAEKGKARLMVDSSVSFIHVWPLTADENKFCSIQKARNGKIGATKLSDS
jgi:hypothetical protein